MLYVNEIFLMMEYSLLAYFGCFYYLRGKFSSTLRPAFACRLRRLSVVLRRNVSCETGSALSLSRFEIRSLSLWTMYDLFSSDSIMSADSVVRDFHEFFFFQLFLHSHSLDIIDSSISSSQSCHSSKYLVVFLQKSQFLLFLYSCP